MVFRSLQVRSRQGRFRRSRRLPIHLPGRYRPGCQAGGTLVLGPLHHIQRHQLAARFDLLERLEHHPMLPHHFR